MKGGRAWRYRLVHLGCAKNRVDGEVTAGLLEEAGLRAAGRADDAELIVVNTCSFIEAAREESVGAILREAERKESGSCRALVVTGCLPQMFGRELAAELPEVDLFLGTGDFHRLPAFLDNLKAPGRGLAACVAGAPSYLYDADTPRAVSGPSAYVKIAEGCSNRCAYCVIGRLRGPFRSRAPDDVLREVERLAEKGAREICLISQDTTGYGRDLSPPAELTDLLGRVLEAAPDIWIRLLYLHPARVTDDLLELMAASPGLCSYLDVPVQHASDRVLGLMNRPGGRGDLEELVSRIRRLVPGAAVRTSLIVGHPGEGEAEFAELLEFVRAAEFDHLGVFTYSPEEGTVSRGLPGRVPAEAAEERRHAIMEEQAVISQRKNEGRVGRTLRVLLERESEDYPGHLEGRAEFQAPEVDGIVLAHGRGLAAGEFAEVEIEDAACYDLAGRARGT